LAWQLAEKIIHCSAKLQCETFSKQIYTQLAVSANKQVLIDFTVRKVKQSYVLQQKTGSTWKFKKNENRC